MAPSVLMVAEKPSFAQSIAEILYEKKCSTKKGFNGACSIHEWNGQFRAEAGVFNDIYIG